MPEYGFLVELEARADKQNEVERFLADAQVLVNDEPGTLAWFAFRIGPSPVITPVDVLASKLG